MSTNTYSLTVHNTSNTPLPFSLLFSLPPPTNGPPPSDVFRSVYASSPPLPSGPDCHLTFTMQPEFFAVCGVSRKPLEVGTRLHADAVVPVILGQEGGTLVRMTVVKERPVWVGGTKGKGTIKVPGGFGVRTDSSWRFPGRESPFLALGALAPTLSSPPAPASTPAIIPLQSFLARPNLLTTFHPTIRYLLTTGAYAPGTIVDASQIGASVEVDFEKTSAVREMGFVYDDRGVYVPDEGTRGVGGWVVRDEGWGVGEGAGAGAGAGAGEEAGVDGGEGVNGEVEKGVGEKTVGVGS